MTFTFPGSRKRLVHASQVQSIICLATSVKVPCEYVHTNSMRVSGWLHVPLNPDVQTLRTFDTDEKMED